jgi:hypothetical protein
MTNRAILSGDVFDIVSDDPDSRPELLLLQVQWDMLRMVALAAGGEIRSLDDGEDRDFLGEAMEAADEADRETMYFFEMLQEARLTP